MLPLLSSCIMAGDDGALLEVPDTVMVTFSLGVHNQAVTKADSYDWGDNYPSAAGDNFENTINTTDLLVMAFDQDGTFVRELPLLACTETASGVVEVRLAFDVDAAGTAASPMTYKFMVLANCTSSSYHLSYSADGTPDVDGLMYSVPLAGAIPMWGVTTYTFQYTDDVLDSEQDLGTISLLRAVAKVGVGLSESLVAEGYSISGLSLNRAGASGYSAPSGWNTTPSTPELTHEGAFRPGAVLSRDVNVWGYGTSTGMKYMYVPETQNASDDELAISVTLSRTEDGSVVETLSFPGLEGIRFCDYASGIPTSSIFDIVRNHFYEYTITKLNTGKELALTLNVKNWDLVTEDVSFTNEVTVSQKMSWSGTYLSPSPEDESILYIDGSHTVSDAVQSSFKIDTPTGATWYASFEGDKDAFSFLVETTEDDADRLEETTTRSEDGVVSIVYWKKVTSVTGEVGEEATLRIITNSAEVSDNKSVSLKIVVLTMDGRTIMVNDLLMPEALKEKDYYQIRQNLS